MGNGVIVCQGLSAQLSGGVSVTTDHYRMKGRNTRMSMTRTFTQWGIVATLILPIALQVARAEPWLPLTEAEVRAMPTEQLYRQSCRDQQLADDLIIAADKYGGLLLKESPSPVYERSHEEAQRAHRQTQEQISRIARLLIEREEALPACPTDRY
jgi:hypothetical protein